MQEGTEKASIYFCTILIKETNIISGFAECDICGIEVTLVHCTYIVYIYIYISEYKRLWGKCMMADYF